MNSNDDLLKFLLIRQIDLLRFSNSVQKDLLKILIDSEAQLRDEIERRVDTLIGKGITDSYTLKRLKALDQVIKDIRLSNYDEITRSLKETLLELSKDESQHIKEAIATSLPVILDLVTPEAARLRAIVERNPFQGMVLKDLVGKLAKIDIDRITSSVKIGLVNGRTTNEIVRSIFSDKGVISLSKKNLSTVTRTAIMDIANSVRTTVYDENKKYFDKEVYVATLDSRTTPICRANDGKIFERGKGLKPPSHYNCRSIRVPLLTDELIGERPIKPVTEKQLLREFSKANQLGTIKSRDNLPKGFKGEFDKYSRRRTRELIGRVPAKITYEDFLRSQSVEFQEDVLGKSKAKLFRDGGLKLDKFIDSEGKELTLPELSSRYKEAFRKAELTEFI